LDFGFSISNLRSQILDDGPATLPPDGHCPLATSTPLCSVLTVYYYRRDWGLGEKNSFQFSVFSYQFSVLS
jgi:hypothetical protein